MYYKTKEELIRKVGIFGLNDVSKLAPIGDLGYVNGWYPPFFGNREWAWTELPRLVKENAVNQGYEFELIGYNHRGTDSHYYCRALEMHFHVDSSD